MNAETISRHKPFLEEFIDPDYGLLDELLRLRAFTAKDVRNIKCENPYHNRNVKVLENVIEGSKCESFLASLRNTKQGHIVNFLAADGEYQAEYGLDWPLKEQQLEILSNNQGVLIDLIELPELLGKLFCEKVINKRQRDFIESRDAPHTKNEAFLEILRRWSQADYSNTIKCLHESRQSHVAEILEEGGVTVRIHVETNETTEEEREIAEKFNRILGDKSAEERRRILELTQLNFIAAKPGQSVVLYIHCQKPKEVQLLQMSIESGCFKHLVQQLFDQLVHRSKKTRVLEISVADDELARTKLFLEESLSFIEERKDNRTITQKKIAELPLELQDIILQKCYLLCALNRIRETRLQGHKSISKVASASFCWFERFKKRKFKVSIQRKLLEGDETNPPKTNDLLPLHLTAGAGYKDVVSMLLKRGRNVRARDNGGHQSLHLAAANGHTEIVILLLDQGGDVNARDNCGCQL